MVLSVTGSVYWYQVTYGRMPAKNQPSFSGCWPFTNSLFASIDGIFICPSYVLNLCRHAVHHKYFSSLRIGPLCRRTESSSQQAFINESYVLGNYGDSKAHYPDRGHQRLCIQVLTQKDSGCSLFYYVGRSWCYSSWPTQNYIFSSSFQNGILEIWVSVTAELNIAHILGMSWNSRTASNIAKGLQSVSKLCT